MENQLIETFYCPDGRCWIADFVDDPSREFLYGTTEIPLPWYSTADRGEVIRFLQERYPEHAIRLREPASEEAGT